MKKLISETGDSALRDPYVIKHNGKYYRCYTAKCDIVSVACADTLDGLREAEGKTVYVPKDPKCGKEIWAPELHIIDGKCYIYVACDDGNNHNHRMYVLENGSSDPLDAYTLKGKISDGTDRWAIDGTVFEIKGKRYFIWSGWEGYENVSQQLYIAEMNGPCELKGERHLISEPEHEWEKRGATGKPESPFINEGAFGIYVNGEYYLLYSASGSWCADYCIAAMKLIGDDPLDRRSWKKFESPIISSNELVKGAGHCSVISENGELCVFFHAWDKDETTVKWNTVSLWQGKMKVDGDKITVE